MITGEPTVDTKLELIKQLGDVQSDIKDNITSDFIYAKLGDKDKKMITEMTANAYYATKTIETLAIKTKKWYWNNKLKQWDLKTLQNQDKTILKAQSKNTFRAFMIRPMMTAILNRNVNDNHYVKGVMGTIEAPEPEEIEERPITPIQKIKEKIKPEQT